MTENWKKKKCPTEWKNHGHVRILLIANDCKVCGKVGKYDARSLSYCSNWWSHMPLQKKDVTSIEQVIQNQPNIEPSEVQSAFAMPAF